MQKRMLSDEELAAIGMETTVNGLLEQIRALEAERDRLLVHLAAAAGRLGYGDAACYLKSDPVGVIKEERRLARLGKALAEGTGDGKAT